MDRSKRTFKRRLVNKQKHCMINFSITTNSQKIIDAHKVSAKKLAIAYYVALRELGNQNTKEIRSNIKPSGGTGRMYRRRIRGRIVQKQSSGQEQHPISWTGRLKGGNKSRVNSPTSVLIYNNAPHAGFVEHKSKAKGGRPFMGVTIMKNFNKNADILNTKIISCIKNLT